MSTKTRQVPYSYLREQFAPNGDLSRTIVTDILAELYSCQFTLGPWVERFEEAFAETVGMDYAVGVSNGTDGLVLSLKALGVTLNEPVLTVPNSFVATTGAILQAGARPIFCDVGQDYLIDWQKASQITAVKKPRIAIPVDLTGMPYASPINHETGVAGPPRHHVPLPPMIVRDACQAVGARYDGLPLAKSAALTVYSLHPLKNVNVWGDGGVIVTDSPDMHQRLRLLRNHGLQDRDTVAIPGYNHRLDSIQAIVGFHALKQLGEVSYKRRALSHVYDDVLHDVTGVRLPPRDTKAEAVFHTYVIQVEWRQDLQNYLADQGIETKIHYPIPIHLQPGYGFLGYCPGHFPQAERQAKRILSLPIHQYLTVDDVEYTANHIQQFYRQRGFRAS